MAGMPSIVRPAADHWPSPGRAGWATGVIASGGGGSSRAAGDDGVVVMRFDESTSDGSKSWSPPFSGRSTARRTAEGTARRLTAREARIAELEARLADLEERLGRNPRNSSMPPSAEGLAKPPPPTGQQRRAAGRRPGKQPGAEGKHLAQVSRSRRGARPHAPAACPDCGADLSDAEVVDDRAPPGLRSPEDPPSSPSTTWSGAGAGAAAR